MLDLYNKPLTF